MVIWFGSIITSRRLSSCMYLWTLHRGLDIALVTLGIWSQETMPFVTLSEESIYHFLHVYYCIQSSHVLVESTVITQGWWVTQSCICDCVCLSVGPKTRTKLLFDLPGVSRSDFKIHTSTSLPWCTSVFYLWILWYIGDISKCLDYIVKEWTTSLLTNACSWVEVVMDIQYFVLEAQVLIKIAGIVFFVGHHFWHQPVEAGENKCLEMCFTSSFFKYIFSKDFQWSDEERNCWVSLKVTP